MDKGNLVLQSPLPQSQRKRAKRMLVPVENLIVLHKIHKTSCINNAAYVAHVMGFFFPVTM